MIFPDATEYKRHDSMRGWFAYQLYIEMYKNDKIWLVVGDLGYKVFDQHFKDFPERCINTGAAEQAMMGVAVGLALEGKIPVVYSITPFLIWRAAETIRLYIDHEAIPVKLIGSGRDKDYAHDGFSHDASDIKGIVSLFDNIKQLWPKTKEEIPSILEELMTNNRPYFLSLTR